MKKFNKIMALLAALCLTLALAGCNDAKDAGNTDNKTEDVHYKIGIMQ